MSTFIRVGRDVMTDEIVVEAYSFIAPKDRTELCSFCDQVALWQVGDGDVLYCANHRTEEQRGQHSFWVDLDVIKAINITTDDGGIHVENMGWRLWKS